MQPKYEGMAYLKTAKDLLYKLKHDLKRLKDEPANAYAAFDFFITAEHLFDWKYKDFSEPHEEKEIKLRGKRKCKVKNNRQLLKLISHIGSGAKHFVATDARHKSVTSIENEQYLEPGYCQSDYVAGEIVINLSDREAKLFIKQQISAVELATETYKYWSAKISH